MKKLMVIVALVILSMTAAQTIFAQGYPTASFGGYHYISASGATTPVSSPSMMIFGQIIPTVLLTKYYHVNSGETISIPIYLTNGGKPGTWWDVTFYDGSSRWTVHVTSSPYMLEVSPSYTRSYCIPMIWNGEVNGGDMMNTITVMVDPPSSVK